MHDLPAVIKRCGIAVIAAVVAACTAVPVSQDYALDYDFANVASYAWLTPDNEQREPAYDALMHERYRDAIEAQMALRGVKKVAVDSASVLVSYHVGTVEKTRVESVGNWYSHFGYYPCYHCYHRPGFGYAHFYDDDIWVREYTQDNVVIDIIEPENRRLVWRGSASRVKPTLKDPLERRAYIDETVATILAQFPPVGAQ